MHIHSAIFIFSHSLVILDHLQFIPLLKSYSQIDNLNAFHFLFTNETSNSILVLRF